MRFSEEDVRAAAAAASFDAGQIGRLIEALQSRSPSDAAASAERFDLVHLLWYAGALIVMGAMGLFSTIAFERMGGQALTATALVYAILFASVGHYLWHERGLRIPGGLLITVAVSMAPLAVYGIQATHGVWGDSGNPGQYKDFFVRIRGGWVPMEVATVLAGLVALIFYPFPFIVAVIALALWFMSMDLALWLFGTADLSWSLRKTVSMWFGLAVLLIAWTIDVRRSRRGDFAFWLHLCGLLAFWCGLTLRGSDSELVEAIYCLLNVGLIFLSIFLMRRAYAVFGALGVTAYLGHLANVVFKDSLLFPFALSLIGVAVIAAGLFLHKRHAALSAWMATRLPEPLRRLRPAHAAGNAN